MCTEIDVVRGEEGLGDRDAAAHGGGHSLRSKCMVRPGIFSRMLMSTLSRAFSWFSVLLIFAGCGSDSESPTLVELQWSFDYSNYLMNASSELRGCENGSNSAVAAVSVSATDPNGVLEGFEATFSCSEGDASEGSNATILSNEDGRYYVVAEGLVSGQALYRLERSDVRFARGELTALTLPAAVGEVVVRPDVSGVAACDGEVGVIQLDFFEIIDGTPAATSTTGRSFETPCDGAEFRDLEVYELPAVPTRNGNDFVERRYLVSAEATGSSGDRLGCASFERNLNPGPAIGVQSVLLTLSNCP